MIEIEYIRDKDLINALNNPDDYIDSDELYGCTFIYDDSTVTDSEYILYFDIENGYYVKGNIIKIPRDFSTFHYRHIGLEEPFEGGGMPDEIFELIKVFIDRFKQSIRDNKIEMVLDADIEVKQKAKTNINSKLEEIRKNLLTNDLDKDILSIINSNLDEVLKICN